MKYLVAIYLLVCLLLMFVFFPTLKDFLLKHVVLLWQQLRRSFYLKWYRLSNVGRMSQKHSVTPALNHQPHKPAREYMTLAMVAGCLIILPPLLVLMIAGKNILEDFDDTQTRESNDQILALLNGEKLVAPPALPPEMFMTQEVLLVRPALVDASRDWVLLDDNFSQRLLVIFKIMKEQHGYEMALLEGYRSPSRQDSLAKMGSNVTNAKAYQSYHQFGLAADCAFKRDGKLVVTEKDPWAMRGYQLYGEVAKSVGLNWGGDWKMMDLGHVELRKPNTIKR
jgi:peptidoglycan L-alanyl-D-glutamate endopeptidase CwlK